jgi:15-cis-phytoene synthase
MQSNFEHCAALVRDHDRDRYLATLFAPAEGRDALFALYAFNVEISRVRELAREPMPGEIRLQWWREVLSGDRDGEAAAHPVAAALRDSQKSYKIGTDGLVAVIDAHAFDLYDEPMATLDDLDNYAARTQSNVFDIAAGILGGRNVQAMTRHAGIAYGIVGILSGLGRHVAHRQLYVPLEVLDRHGVNREDIFAQQVNEPLTSALAELRRHARRQLAAAQAEMATPNVFPALLPVALAGPQLRAMDCRGYRPFGDQPMSGLHRQWLLWRAARDPRRMFRA